MSARRANLDGNVITLIEEAQHCRRTPFASCSETSMLRRTKIVATLGPVSVDPKALDGIIQAGEDVVRINFSHGEPDEHRRRGEAVRNRARAHGRQVGVLADLQGPKIRIDRFKDGKVNLIEGD